MSAANAPRRPNWIIEHGDEYDVPDVITKAEGMVDVSWHNDACPSFEADDLSDTDDSLRLWVDHPEPDSRESTGDGRFVVTYLAWGDAEHDPVPGLTQDIPIHCSDDPRAAVVAYVQAARVIRAYRRENV